MPEDDGKCVEYFENGLSNPLSGIQMIQYLKYVIVVLVCLNMTACSIKSMVISEIAQVAEQGISAFETDDDLVLMENAFPANIK